MIILLRFGDNDFHKTLRAFGELLTLDQPENLTKYQVVELWNELSFGLYLLAQNQWRYKDSPEEKAHIRNYLKIQESFPSGAPRVLIGEEVKKYLEDNATQGNYEWLFVQYDPYVATCEII